MRVLFRYALLILGLTLCLTSVSAQSSEGEGTVSDCTKVGPKIHRSPGGSNGGFGDDDQNNPSTGEGTGGTFGDSDQQNPTTEGGDGGFSDSDMGGDVPLTPPSRLYVEETSVRCGSQAVIPVLFENEAEYGGLQFEVTLPEGITLNKVTKTERLSDDFVLQKSKTGENTWQILLYNSNRLSFNGNDGVLFTMTVDVADEMAVGDYTMTFSDIVASGVDESQEDLADFSTTITVEKYLIGDANRDNRVNVTDIMAVANYILKQPSSNFNEKAADVNNDNRINVTDIMGIANIILKVNPAQSAPARIRTLDPQ